MNEPTQGQGHGSLLLLSATWAMAGFLLATSLLSPMLRLAEGDAAASLQAPPADRDHAVEQARLVVIREAVAGFHENNGRYPTNLEELVVGRWLHASVLLAPGRTGLPFYRADADGYTLLPWRN